MTEIIRFKLGNNTFKINTRKLIASCVLITMPFGLKLTVDTGVNAYNNIKENAKFQESVEILGERPIYNETEYATVYIAQNGDTLSTIAEKFGMSADEFARLNNIEDNKRYLINAGKPYFVVSEIDKNLSKSVAYLEYIIGYLEYKTSMDIEGKSNVAHDALNYRIKFENLKESLGKDNDLYAKKEIMELAKELESYVTINKVGAPYTPNEFINSQKNFNYNASKMK